MLREQILSLSEPEAVWQAIAGHPGLETAIASAPQARELFMPVIVQSRWTAAHAVGVAVVIDAMHKVMDAPQQQRQDDVVAGLLHDIGKVDNPKLPLSLINKSAPLTRGEFSAIKTHPREGYDRLIEAGLPEIATLVVGHHEHQGESSYPRRNPREDTPPRIIFGQQLIAVGDNIDAFLDPNRPYREPARPKEVKEHVLRKFGTIFRSSYVDVGIDASVLYMANRV